MVIDSHQHFWKYHPLRHEWINDSMKVLKRDFMPDDLWPVLEKNSFDGCIAVQAEQSLDETKFLLNIAQNHNFVKGVIGWVDLQGENLEGELNLLSQNKFFKGVRHIVQDEPDINFMLRPEFLRGIELLSVFELPFDILVYPHQLEAAIELTNIFPEQRFILDHMGKPRYSNGLDVNWIQKIESLAQRSNVFCKLSGFVTETENYSWRNVDFAPFFDFIIKVFGFDRILFGSDWPVCHLAGSYSEIVSYLTRYLQSYEKDTIVKIMGENAIRVYSI